MEVKVKKKVLFNVIKKMMTERHGFMDAQLNGNFVGSYGKDSEPIKPVSHVATQLSVEAPPVEDPDYVPASKEELAAASIRMAEEVPSDQVEFFYRQLHKLLDAALDNQDERSDYDMGYKVGMQVAAGEEALMPDQISESYMAGYRAALNESDKELVIYPELVNQRPQLAGQPPIEFLKVQLYFMIRELSLQFEAEYFEKLASGSEETVPTSLKYGITFDNSFHPQNLAKKGYSKDKLVQTIKTVAENILKQPQFAEFKQNFGKVALQERLGDNELINRMAQEMADQIVEKDKPEYSKVPVEGIIGQLYASSFNSDGFWEQGKEIWKKMEQRLSDDDVLPAKDLIGFFRKKTAGPQRDKFLRLIPTDLVEDVLSLLKQYMIDLAKKVKKIDYNPDVFDDAIEEHILAQHTRATEASISQDSVEKEAKPALSPEEKAERTVSRRLAKLESGKANEFDLLAPFFGFSGASGLRQWFLKFPQRKLKALMIRDEEGTAPLMQLYQISLSSLLDPVLEALPSLIAGREGDFKGLLEDIKEDLEALKGMDFDTNNPEVQRSLGALGGRVLRYINEALFKSPFANFDKDLTDSVADVLKSKYSDLSDKQAKSAAEYFTGKKNLPDYNKMTKAAKNLSAMGIDSKRKFDEIYLESEESFNQLVEDEFAEFDVGGENFVGEYREKVQKKLSGLKGKKMQTAILDAVEAMLDDFASSAAMKRIASGEAQGDES